MPITPLPPTTLADITIPFKIKWGDAQESSEGYLAKASLTFRVNWADRWTFVEQITGFFDGVVHLPCQHPDATNLLTESTATKGVGYGSCEVPYRYAEVTVNFATPQYSIGEGSEEAMLSIEYDAAGSIVTMPDRTFTFASSGVKVDQSVGVLVPSTTINITRYRVATINTSVYESCVGKMNQGEFFGRAENTVLCMPIKSQTQVSVGGVAVTNLTYSFAWRAVPYTHLLAPNGTWQEVTPWPYSQADLGALFA